MNKSNKISNSDDLKLQNKGRCSCVSFPEDGPKYNNSGYKNKARKRVKVKN